MVQTKGWQILTAMHATVDALCACCLFALVPLMSRDDVFTVFVLYNCLAFLTQPITGLWIDMIGTRHYALILSVVLLLVGSMLETLMLGTTLLVSPYLIALFIGLGNSLFHVFGGKYVTHYSRNDMRHLGAFVSTGALGIFIGERVASIVGLSTVMLCLIILSVLFVKFTKKQSSYSNYYYASSRSYDSGVKYGIPLFLFILVVVAFRSFLGKMIPYTASEIVYFPFYACGLAVFGKAFGGFVARWIGTGTALFATLFLAGCSFLLGYYSVGFILAMILFVNLSMPITLHLANRCFPRYEGFAFGMLAALLIPGYALGQWSVDEPLAYHLLYPLISTIIIEALVLLLFKERRWKVLCSSVIINMLTNVPLNLYVQFADRYFTIADIIILEGIVVVVEVLIYYIVTRNYRQALLYGVMCNVISYFTGYIFLTYIR